MQDSATPAQRLVSEIGVEGHENQIPVKAILDDSLIVLARQTNISYPTNPIPPAVD
jgi:hypothetical protein